MDPRTAELAKDLDRNSPGGDVARLRNVASAQGVELPGDYVEFMSESDGGEGDVGATWLELWSVSRIVDEAERDPRRYEGVFLFAGNGANTVYGFDTASDNEIVEGDWIGLNRDELTGHGRTLRDFLESLANGPG